MFFVNHFEYDGIKSAQFGLAFRHIDTERLKRICGEVKRKTTYYPTLHKRAVHKNDFEEFPFEFEVEFICERPLNLRQKEQVERWLFNSPTYKKLYQDPRRDESRININGEIKRLYVECIFYNPEEIRFADGLHGWKCVCELSSGLAFQDEIEYGFNDFTNDITIDVNSDLTDYIYPTLVVTADNKINPIDVSITNVSDDNRSMILEDITALTEIYIDCPIGSVIDSTGTSLFTHLLDRKFLRLLPGKNVLQISGIDTLKIKYQNVRYIL